MHLLAVCRHADIAKRHVLADRSRVAPEILKDYTVQLIQLADIVLTYIASVEQHRALGRVVQTRQQLDQRCFSGAVQTDEHNRLSRLDSEVDLLKHIPLGAGIAERNTAKLYAVSAVALRLYRLRQTRYKSGLFVHKIYHIVDKQRSLIDSRRRCD